MNNPTPKIKKLPRLCTMPLCFEKHEGLGLCAKHYMENWEKLNKEKRDKYNKNYRIENAEQIRKRAKQQYNKNKEYITKIYYNLPNVKLRHKIMGSSPEAKKLRAEWARKHRQKINLRNKENYHKNIDKIREHKKNYYHSNPEIFKAIRKRQNQKLSFKLYKRESCSRRRAKILHLQTDKITKEQIKNILFSSPICPMCGRFVECENLTIDHIIPLNKKGTHTISNLQALCGACNSAKKDYVRG